MIAGGSCAAPVKPHLAGCGQVTAVVNSGEVCFAGVAAEMTNSSSGEQPLTGVGDECLLRRESGATKKESLLLDRTPFSIHDCSSVLTVAGFETLPADYSDGSASAGTVISAGTSTSGSISSMTESCVDCRLCDIEKTLT